MNPEEFTITFSNSSSNLVFGNNTISNFRYRLPSPVDFQNEKWEVALVSFSFPTSWFLARNYADIHSEKITIGSSFPNAQVNVHADIQTTLIPNLQFETYIYGQGGVRNRVIVKDQVVFDRLSTFTIPVRDIKNEIPIFGKFAYTKIREAEATNVAGIIAAGGIGYFNNLRQMEKFKDLGGFITNLVENPSENLKESDILSKGADTWEIDEYIKATVTEDYILPIQASLREPRAVYLPAIFVYAQELVEFQNVGSKLKPLLGFVPAATNDETRDVIKYEPRQRHFKSLGVGYISEIGIELKDVFDELLIFKTGEVILELQFRKCK